MTIIEEIAEDARREMLQCQRHAIRSGAKMYARSRRTRIDTLHRMNITGSNPALPLLKNHLRALIKARHTSSWLWSRARYIGVMQCIGGELILAKEALTND